MIITKTPLRISFFGGGTDLENFWKHENGSVMSCSINKYIYVVLKKSSDEKFHLKHYENENVDHIEDIKHDLIREALRKTGITEPIELAILSDISHEGSGLGSSSSLAVGLLHAFYTYKGLQVDPKKLADDACDLEINILSKPIGKQDQYAAAYGGLNVFTFQPGGAVKVTPISAKYNIYKQLNDYLLLFYTGIGRQSAVILKEQNNQVQQTRPILQKMKDQVTSALDIINQGELYKFGNLIYDGWEMKKQLANLISNDFINNMVTDVLNAGASAAKISGAGGGGFLLVFCKPENHDSVRKSMNQLQEFDFTLEKGGTEAFTISN